MANYRNFIRSTTGGFDGTTAESAAYAQTGLVWQTPTATAVGIWSPTALGRSNCCSLVRVALEGTLLGSDTVAAVADGGQTRVSRVASLDSSGWIFLNPTDDVRITCAGGTRANILVSDLLEEEVADWVLAEIAAGGQTENVSFLVVTGTQAIPAWTGTCFAFINCAAPAILTLPAAALQSQVSRLVLVRTGGIFPLVQAAGTDTINGVASSGFQISGRTAIEVYRAGAGYTSSAPILTAVTNLANAVAGATVDLPQSLAPNTDVQIDYTAAGFLRLPVLAEAPLEVDQLVQRTPGGGTSQAVLIPRAGEIVNGEVDGRVYLGERGVLRIRRNTVGWCVTSDGGRRRAQKLIHAANTTLPLWGAGLLMVDCTQAAAQTETMPLSTLPICEGAQALFAALGAGGLTINGNGYSIRPGGGVAPAGTLVVAQFTNVLLTFTGTEYTAIVT